jgi:ubiquinone/menaquinone biosynthesis C-methylase UbiE
MERVLHAELLDHDAGSPREIDAALRSLRWVNRLFGGNAMHARLLQRAAAPVPRRDLHLLEVACGHAAALQYAALRLMATSPRLHITLLDRSPLHFPGPHLWDHRLPVPRTLVADALDMPLPDNSVDVVSNCLFLHHLPEDDAATFLSEALRVARVAVVINDLERSHLHYFLARIFGLVDPSRISRHDGPASVRQAYTRAELECLLRQTGCRFEICRGRLFRLGAIVWK